MNKKSLLTIIILIVVAILAAIMFGVALWDRDDKVVPPTETNTRSTTTPATSFANLPVEYVKLTNNTASEARFVFAIPVNAGDIKSTNIRHCVINVSVSAEAENVEPECNDASPANGFTLEYNASSRTLKIVNTKPEDWGANSGPFKIGCAACVSAVEFGGIRTPSGELFPTKLVEVY